MAMFGLIGRARALPGRRDDLVSVLADGAEPMPGCLSYVVAEDPSDPDGVWVTEVWEDQAAHRASLQLPSVQERIQRGRPLIVDFDQFHETRPVAGVPGAAR